MSRKRNRSRLTKADLDTICEMQRKIDAYESYIIGLAGLSSPGKTLDKNYIILEFGTEMDELVLTAWNNIKAMKSVCERHLKEGLDNFMQ